TVWWKWVAPADGNYTFAADSSSSNPTIAIFTGASVDALTELISDADADPKTGFESRVFFAANGGAASYVQVGARPATSPGTSPLSGEQNAVPNDDFANAAPFGSDNGSRTGWNVGATLQPGEPNPFGDFFDYTAWYSWTPTADGSGLLS